MKSYSIDTLPMIYADAFISVGNNCRSAYWLKQSGLRKCALPLDWMREYPLSSVINMLKDSKIKYFSDFLETPVSKTSPHRSVKCKISQLEAIHHFPIAYSVEEYLPIFTKKFNERIIRFRNLIKKSNKICIIMNRADPILEIFNFMSELAKLYPKKYFVLINIRLGKNKITKYELNKYIHFYEWICKDINEDGTNEAKNPKCWIGNTKIWKSAMSKLRFTPKTKRPYIVKNQSKYTYF